MPKTISLDAFYERLRKGLVVIRLSCGEIEIFRIAVDVGYTVITKAGKMQNYLGRIDPAPRCDGKPSVEGYPK